LLRPFKLCILEGNGVFALNKILLILALFALFPLPAFAQADEDLPEMMTYDPTHTGMTNQAAEEIRQRQKQSQVDKGFIRPEMVQVSIVRLPYMDENQFGIQMAVPDVVSGCYELTPLEYEANFIDPHYLDIKVKKYRRVAPENGAAKNCDRQNKMSTALMVLDRKDLETRGTKEIRFSTEAATDTYEILLDGRTLALVPKSMVVFKGQNLGGPLKDRLVYNFTGSNMITLQVPMARPGEDVSFQVTRFAASRALSPAPDQSGNRIFYFHDQMGDISSQIGEDGYAEVGKIIVNRPYDGPQGRTETAVELSVFATRPGTEL
jgi:hypothetical protein